MTIRFTPWDDRAEFAKWKTEVQVAVEADDFATHVLWGQWAKGGTRFWRRVGHDGVESVDNLLRVDWEEGRVGTMAQVGKPLSGVSAENVLTCVSLNVDKLDGVPVLFYWATSMLVDHAAMRNFVEDTFVNAKGRLHDVNNFHNAISDVRALNKKR